MITGNVSLGPVQLDDNLVLTGIEINADTAYSVRELLGGPAVIQMDARDVGAQIAVTAIRDGSRRQGQFCQYQIDELKSVAKLRQPVSLVHPKGMYSVYILDFVVIETDEREAPQPNKKYHGSIICQEV